MNTAGAQPLKGIKVTFDREKAFRNAQGHSRMVKLLRVLLPAMALGAFGLYLIPQKVPSINIGPGTLEIDTVDTSGRMLNPAYSGSDEKNGNYKVTAKYAEPNLKQPHIIGLFKIRAQTENAKKEWVRMNATQGVMNTRKNELQLTQGIQINTSSGMAAKLSSALVEMKKQLIRSEEPVSVTLPNGTVYSDKMQVHSSQGILRFEQNVQVHLENNAPQKTTAKKQAGLGAMFKDSRDPIDVASQELIINDKKKTALFRGQVSAVQSDMTLQAGNLQIAYKGSTGLTAAGDQSQAAPDQSISKVTAVDNVIITTGDGRMATAEQTEFDNLKQQVTLSRKVIVKQGQNTLKGNKLVVDLKKRHSYFPPGGRVHGHFEPEPGGQAKKKKTQPAQNIQKQNQDPLAQGFAGFSQQGNEPFDISANSLSIYDQKRYAIFKGNVKVDRGKSRILAGYLKLNYEGDAPVGPAGRSDGSSQNAQIKSIIARKKVLITTANNQAMSGDQAVFDVKKNTVIVEGNVTVTQGDNVLKGNKVVINLTTGVFNLQADRQRVRTILNPGNFQPPGQ